MADSFIIAESVELLGGPGGVASTDPRCAGAIFRLLPGYDLGAPAPTTDIVGSLLLDGERPFGRRASNRTITLPVLIKAPDFFTLSAAREVLLDAIDAQYWTLRWTRDTAGTFAGSSTSMPMLLDCFRAQPSVYKWGGVDQYGRFPYGIITLTFQALPYGRSDLPQVVNFQSPVAGQAAPASPVTVDAFGTVSGTHWSQVTLGPSSPHSAYYTTGGTGAGVVASYSKSGLSLDLTGLSALTVWAGFGSTTWWLQWGMKSGPVRFAFTLTDGTHSSSFSVTRKVRMSNESPVPVWQKIRVPIVAGNVNLAAVTGYTVTVSNRAAGDLQFTDLYLNGLIAVPPPSVAAVNPTAGAVYDLAGILGSARAPLSLQLQQAAGTTTTVTKRFTTAGASQWLCPAGVTTVKAECVGGGGRGGQSTGSTNATAGGGGGEYAAEATLAVTPGTVYGFTVGAGASTASVSGGTTTFAGDSVTVTAHGGGSVPDASLTAGVAGTGSANTTHHNGGAGGAGASVNEVAGGGGGSGGPTGAGGSGAAAGTGTGGTAGSGGSPAGAGGAGAAFLGTGNAGARAGGGGGGCTGAFAFLIDFPGNGAPGEIALTYTQTATFKTLVVHRPNPDAPDTLTPFVQVPVTDTPDGGTEYLVPSLVGGQNARFAGTYTIVLVSNSWDAPNTSRTLTVTVKQYEQAGGNSYSQSVALAVTPNSLPGPLAVLGELSLPNQGMAGDNLNGYFTVTVTSTDTADRFQDVLFLDTMGQTVLIQSPNAYVTYFIDEPATDRDIGHILGSVFDRADAVSVIGSSMISGPTPHADPAGSAILLVYAAEGAPSCQMTYWPRWMLDRVDRLWGVFHAPRLWWRPDMASDKSYATEARFNAARSVFAEMATDSQANFTSEKTFATWTIPAADPVQSATYGLAGWGDASSTGTPTLTLRLRLGGPSGALLMSDGGAATGSGVSQAGIGVLATLGFEQAGASGNLNVIGHLMSNAGGGATVAVPVVRRRVVVDTTSDIVIAWTAQWSAADPANVAESTLGQLTRMLG